jgi:enamine deaminase RidA (YjgF/YER057c/UK114 family)
LHLAGQIALQPATMRMIESADPYEQLRLCTRHQVAVEKSLSGSQKVTPRSPVAHYQYRYPLVVTMYARGVSDDIRSQACNIFEEEHGCFLKPLYNCIDVVGLPRNANIELQSVVLASSSEVGYIKKLELHHGTPTLIID